jgi:hypothetical protein
MRYKKKKTPWYDADKETCSGKDSKDSSRSRTFNAGEKKEC